MEELTTYAPVLPEIVLAVGAMVLLMLGAFRRAAPGRDLAATVLAIGVLCSPPLFARRRSGRARDAV